MENNGYIYAEVLEVLENMDINYVKMIPEKLMQFLKNNADAKYTKHIVANKNLKEQKLNKNTIGILALLNLKYWTKNEEHKKELIDLYKNNSLSYNQEKLKEKYNTDNLFRKEKNSNMQMIEHKENTVFDKIRNWIKHIIKKF